jgi:ATP-binding cassette subfamily C (CFTR/MRP) protein 1
VVLITHQVDFVSKCDKVCIMDAGKVIYFGPWNPQAQQMMSRVLPASHLLAAAGAAEERKEVKKKPAAAAKPTSSLNLSPTNVAEKVQKATRPATSLTMGEAIKLYVITAGILVTLLSLFFFLSAQTTRQISDWW